MVGVNSWVIHNNEEVFGSDAGEFRPERWLGAKSDTSVMEQFFFPVSIHCPLCFGCMQSSLAIITCGVECKIYTDAVPQFGSGARTCIGKNISLLEMSKLIPQLYRWFSFEFAPSTAEGMSKEPQWTTANNWFVKQDFSCRVVPRIIE